MLFNFLTNPYFLFCSFSPHFGLLSLDSRVESHSSVGFVHNSVTLDTPMNRAGMPGADFSSWTPCSEVAE